MLVPGFCWVTWLVCPLAQEMESICHPSCNLALSLEAPPLAADSRGEGNQVTNTTPVIPLHVPSAACSGRLQPQGPLGAAEFKISNTGGQNTHETLCKALQRGQDGGGWGLWRTGAAHHRPGEAGVPHTHTL